MGSDPEDSDLEEVILSDSETESDEEENSDDPNSTSENNQQNLPTTENVTAEAPTPQTASQQLELLPLLSNPDSSIPENEWIERELQAMEEGNRQVTSLANAK